MAAGRQPGGQRGNAEEHERSIKIVREAADDLRKHIGILLDLQGPKIRLGTFENGSATSFSKRATPSKGDPFVRSATDDRNAVPMV